MSSLVPFAILYGRQTLATNALGFNMLSKYVNVVYDLPAEIRAMAQLIR